MSGSSSGGGANLGGGGGIPIADCKHISIKTNVTSPDPTVLKTLKVGDYLDVELQTATGPLIAVASGNRRLGSIFTTNPKMLIDCIVKGHIYHARILKIDGADCQILITAK
ncbi:MAG: hypothetical protein J0M30_07595 [Chitinophagales bacterium]|nr:hypothetical protein [Chitinophagales bacterium]